ncbi:hypothetical protein [Mycolicibacterium neoaurum]|uniref:hypothetical protein n=1 Tax=Mycolicibacterium neoaurum TaxID=1795 RepID=UPI001F1FF8D7|nr:hypothetical protein [Mycolicibacterium neoaurum]
MSVLNLPEPANWTEAGKMKMWVKIFSAAVLLYLVLRAVLAATRGNYLTSVLIIGFAALPILTIAALFLVRKGRVTVSTRSDVTGFTVLADKRFAALLITGLAVLAPSAAALAFLIPRGAIDIPMSRGMQVFSPVVLIAGAMFAVGGLVAIARRGGLGYLKFTPAMIEYADAVKTRRYEWDDIVDIKDHADAKNGASVGRSVVLCLRDGSEQVIGGLNVYVPTGVALYWLFRHYWKHPDDRPELVDARSAERLRNGCFALD